MKARNARGEIGIITQYASRAVILALFSVFHCLAAPATLVGQTTEASDDGQEDRLAELSPFSIEETRGKGYISNQAVSSFKTGGALIDTPQPVVVVPRDLIETLNATMNNLETLKHFVSGIGTFAQDVDLIYIRGFRGSRLGIEGVIQQGSTISDAAFIDSYEVIKGPTAVLYGQRGGLSGVVYKITKKPLDYAAYSLRTTVGTQGLLRGELDLTGPISIGDGDLEIAYRLIGVKQEYDGFHEVDFDNREFIAPSLSFRYRNKTNVLFQYYWSEILRGIGSGDSFLNEAGTDINPVTIRNSFRPRWQYTRNLARWFRGTVEHNFTQDWSARVFHDITYNRNYVQEAANSGNPNYANNTIDSFYYVVDDLIEQTTTSFDVAGKVNFFNIPQTVNFGVVTDSVDVNTRSIFLPGVFPLSPIDNPNRLTFVQPNEQLGPMSQNRPSKSTTAYYSHILKLFDERLHLLGGISHNELRGGTLLNSVTGNPYRASILYKVLPDLSIYINQSTTFAASVVNTPDGQVSTIREDESFEIGMKTALLDGRVSSTVTYFDLQLGSVANWIIGTYPSEYTITPSVYSRGFEFDVAIEPVPGLTVIATYMDTDLKDNLGNTPGYAVRKTYSGFVNYRWDEGLLAGLNLGLTMSHFGGQHSFPYMKHTVYGAHGGFGRDWWRVNFNIDNLTDKVYTSGGYGQPYNTAGRPRNGRVTVDFRW